MVKLFCPKCGSDADIFYGAESITNATEIIPSAKSTPVIEGEEKKKRGRPKKDAISEPETTHPSDTQNILPQVEMSVPQTQRVLPSKCPSGGAGET